MLPVFSFFKKKPFDTDGTLSLLGTDMHSHLVPGVDDGAKDIAESIQLIEGFIELGYHTIITTPHIRPEYFPNTPQTILAGFDKLRAAITHRGLKVNLQCAAEYFVDAEFINYIKNEQLLTFGDHKILIEISTFSAPPNLEEIIFQLRLKGYNPVIAHPERYLHLSDDQYIRLRDMGCELQVNLLSLTGHYGAPTKKQAFKLIDFGVVNYFATDCHNIGHLIGLKAIANEAAIMKKILECNPENYRLAAQMAPR